MLTRQTYLDSRGLPLPLFEGLELQETEESDHEKAV